MVESWKKILNVHPYFRKLILIGQLILIPIIAMNLNVYYGLSRTSSYIIGVVAPFFIIWPIIVLYQWVKDIRG